MVPPCKNLHQPTLQNTFQTLNKVFLKAAYEGLIPYISVLIENMIMDRPASIFSAATILELSKEIIR